MNSIVDAMILSSASDFENFKTLPEKEYEERVLYLLDGRDYR